MTGGARPQGQPIAKQSTWKRFLSGKTSGQRFVLAVGALAGALGAVVGLIVAVVALVGRDGVDSTVASSRSPQAQTSATSGTPAAPSAGEARVANQSADADRFVRDLLATNGRPIQLNTKVIAPDLGSHVRLEYDCGKQTGCSFTRLEMGTFVAARVEGGVWFQGCYSVVREGAGYGADHLDLEFTEKGPTCP